MPSEYGHVCIVGQYSEVYNQIFFSKQARGRINNLVFLFLGQSK